MSHILKVCRKLLFLSVLAVGVHIWHTDCQRSMPYILTYNYKWLFIFDRGYSYLAHCLPWSQGPRQSILKSVLQRVNQTPLTFLDRGCSYLARLLMGCRLQQIPNIPKSTVAKVLTLAAKHIKNQYLSAKHV